MKVNYHTHTPRCNHATGTDKEYFEMAYHYGLDIIGMSDHGPFIGDKWDLRMKYDELEGYLSSMNNYKLEYSGRMQILTGLEIEWLPEYNNYYESLLNDSRMDYLILGEHFFSRGNDYPNIFFAQSTEDYVDYAKNIALAMDTGYFSYIAHPDLMFINDFVEDKNTCKAIDIIVDAAAKRNFILEYNANGYRRGIGIYGNEERYPYPYKAFWDEVAKANVPVVVGSDAHNPSLIWDEYMKKAIADAKELGLNLVQTI